MIWPVGVGDDLTPEQRERLVATNRRLLWFLGVLTVIGVAGWVVALAAAHARHPDRPGSPWIEWGLPIGWVAFYVTIYALGRRNLSRPGHQRTLAASGSRSDIRRVTASLSSGRPVAAEDRTIAHAVVDVQADQYRYRWFSFVGAAMYAALAIVERHTDLWGRLAGVVVFTIFGAWGWARCGRILRHAVEEGLTPSGGHR